MNSGGFGAKCSGGLSIQSDVNYFFTTQLEETDDESAEIEDAIIESIEKDIEDNMKGYSESLMVSAEANCRAKSYQEMFQDYKMQAGDIIPSQSIVHDLSDSSLMQGNENSDSFWDLMDELYSDELDLQVNEMYFNTNSMRSDSMHSEDYSELVSEKFQSSNTDCLANDNVVNVDKNQNDSTHHFSILEQNFISKRSEYQLVNDRLERAIKLWDRLAKLWSTKIFKEETLRAHLHKEKFVLSRSKAKQIQNYRKYRTDSLIQRPIYYRTALNNFLQLVCPECSRNLFGSSLGFLNHCRMVHDLKFLTIDDAANSCGVSVSDSVVPEDDSCRYEITLDYFVAQQKLKKDAQESFPKLSEQRNPLLLSPCNQTTRLFIKKKIIVGNTYKPILNKDKKVESYSWVLYVRNAENDTPIEHYVKKIRFFLHFSFSKNVVEIYDPPFQIQRQSLKPYPVRIQIHLHDDRNKPTSIIHYMTFYSSIMKSPNDENSVEINIDRLYTNGMKLDELQDVDKSEVQVAFDSHESDRRHLPYGTDLYGTSKNSRGFESNNINDLIRRIVKEQFPLVSSSSLIKKTGYSYANSLDEWYSWSHGKRKASEWQRAHRIQQLLAQDYKIFIKTREIINLCQKLKLTPPSPSRPNATDPLNEPFSYEYMYLLPILRSRLEKLEFIEAKSLCKKICFCRFCGCVHLPIYRFDELEQKCGEKKLKILSNLHCSYKKYAEQSVVWCKQSVVDALKNKLCFIQEKKKIYCHSDASQLLLRNFQMNPVNLQHNTTTAYSKSEPNGDMGFSNVCSTIDKKNCQKFLTCQNNNFVCRKNLKNVCEASSNNLADESLVEANNVVGLKPKKLFCDQFVDRIDTDGKDHSVSSNCNSCFDNNSTLESDLTRDSSDDVQKLLSQLKEFKKQGIDTTYVVPETIFHNSVNVTECGIKKKRGRPVKRVSLPTNAFKNETNMPLYSAIVSGNSQNNLKTSLLPPKSLEYSSLVGNVKVEANSCPDSAAPNFLNSCEFSCNSMPTPMNASTSVPHPDFEFKKFEFNSIDSSVSKSLEKILEDILVFAQLDKAAEIMLMKALCCFIRKIFIDTIEVFYNEKATDHIIERKCKVVVPLHTIQAILNHPNRYNFLTEFGLAKEIFAEQIDAFDDDDNC